MSCCLDGNGSLKPTQENIYALHISIFPNPQDSKRIKPFEFTYDSRLLKTRNYRDTVSPWCGTAVPLFLAILSCFPPNSISRNIMHGNSSTEQRMRLWTSAQWKKITCSGTTERASRAKTNHRYTKDNGSFHYRLLFDIITTATCQTPGYQLEVGSKLHTVPYFFTFSFSEQLTTWCSCILPALPQCFPYLS